MDVPDIENKSNLSDDDQDPKALSSTSSQNHLDDPEADQNPSQLQSDLSNSQKLKKDAKSKKPKPKVILNVSDCRYEVVRHVGRKMLGYKVTKDMELEWDVFWTDQAVQPETLARMQTFQKINHFPGMYSLARKNHLGRNLMRMKKAFPQYFKFFPQTYLLPAEYSEFKSQFATKGPKTFIVKPEASCQGRGIFLTKSADSVQPGEHYVVQRYLQKPFLLDNLKFDIRLYVLVAGCDPLRLYLYNDGLARFATEDYVAPTAANIDNMCMHLTNYAINKDNPNFVFNEDTNKADVGHKRSLQSVFKVLEERGHDVKGLWKDIKNIITKTFCGVQPILAHNYKSCQPDEPYNNMCFEVLGLDIILDHKLKPWLLEVNHTPSFTTDTPLDKTIKRNVISDALKLMNVSANHKIRYKNKKKVELQQRVLTGKKVKATPEERQAACLKAQAERDAYENKHLGGYEKVYPFDDPTEQEEPYEEFIKVAHKWWEDWTGTATKKVVKKTAPDNKLPPMTFGGQGGRAKEIQSIYSQKVKLNGSGNPKVTSSNQKSRQPSAVNLNVKPMDSPIDNGLEKTAEKKGESQSMTTTTEGFNPWVVTQSDNPLVQDNRVVGEDDHDYLDDMVPIIERNDLAGEDDDEEQTYNRLKAKISSEATQPMSPGNFGPSSPGAELMAKTQSYLSKGYKQAQGELVTDTQSQMDLMKANSFRIRRTTGTSNSIRNDPSRKGTPNEKENVVKTANSRRPPTLANSLQKLTGIYSASGRKNSEKYFVDNDNSTEMKDKYSRIPYKYITSVNGEVIEGIEKTLETESAPERIHKSATMNDIDKGVIYGKGAPINSRSVGKKPTAPTMMQQNKNAGNGNFLTPKLFELNFQGAKTDISKANATQGIIYNGQKNLARTGKTLQMVKDVMNFGSYTNDTTVNLQKYFGLVDKK